MELDVCFGPFPAPSRSVGGMVSLFHCLRINLDEGRLGVASKWCVVVTLVSEVWSIVWPGRAEVLGEVPARRGVAH